MSAFDRGMQLGIRAWNSAEEARLRNEEMALQKARDARDAELHGATMDEKRRAAARANEQLGILREIQDYQQGIDRQATNAALDADFEAANQAALQGLPVPAVRGGSNAANEQALTVKNAVDPNSLQYQVGLNRLHQRYATVSGDVTKAAELAAQGRLLSFQEAMNAQRQQFTNMTPEERAAFMERVTENAALPVNVVPVAKKGGKGGADYMVWVEGKPRIRVDEATLSDIYAAGNLMGQYGDLARDFLSKGNDKIRQLFKDYVDVTDKIISHNNNATFRDSELGIKRTEANNRAAYYNAAGRNRMEFVDANGETVVLDMSRVPVDPKTGQYQIPPGLRPKNAKPPNEFEVLPEDGARVRDRNGNVYTYFNGERVLQGGVPSTELPKKLREWGFPPQAESLVQPMPGGRHVMVPGDSETVYDLANPDDRKMALAAVNRATQANAAARELQARGGWAPRNPRAVAPPTGLSATDEALRAHNQYLQNRRLGLPQ